MSFDCVIIKHVYFHVFNKPLICVFLLHMYCMHVTNVNLKFGDVKHTIVLIFQWSKHVRCRQHANTITSNILASHARVAHINISHHCTFVNCKMCSSICAITFACLASIACEHCKYLQMQIQSCNKIVQCEIRSYHIRQADFTSSAHRYL